MQAIERVYLSERYAMDAVKQPVLTKPTKPTFSGHESFACRQFWLKKAYDYVAIRRGSFSDPDAVVHLGVGKNMVTSIQYWARAFGVLDDDLRPSNLANYLFGEGGKDPYLEDIGSLFLLHYSLVATGRATIFSLAFNEFRKERLEFTREHLQRFLNRKCEEYEVNVSNKTIERDASTFIRTYLQPERTSRNVEDDYSGLLIDLALLEQIKQPRAAGGEHYRFENREREHLPAEIILFTILEQNHGNSVSFSNLLTQENNAGLVFALTSDGLLRKINEIVERYDGITLADNAGVRELQFVDRPDPWQVLNRYYTVQTNR